MSVADRVPVARAALPVLALAAGVAAWWAATAAFPVPAYLLPTPASVLERLVDRPGLYLSAAWVTAQRVAVGGGIGLGAGFALAVGIVSVPWLRRAVLPYLVALRVLPKIALAPVLLIYLGTGFATAVVFVALVAFFPMVVSAAAGLERAPDRHRDLLASVRADPVDGFLAVTVPFALPDLFAGAKQSVTLAVVGAVVAEWVVATEGLGALILLGVEDVQTDVVLAALLVLFALGLGLYGLVAAAERRLTWEA